MKRHSLHTFFLTVLVPLLAICFSACGGDDYVAVTSVKLNKGSISLAAGSQTGGTETLQPTVEPGNATNKDVEWRSSAPGVASVSNSGQVTAVAAGTAVITVRTLDGGRTANCNVTVTTAASEVVLNRRTLAMVKGYSETLVATVLPANASNRDVVWSSSAPAVVEVSQEGRVTALAMGSATITAATQDGSRRATCAVAVALETIHVTGVALNRSEMSLEANGAPGQLIATVFPADATIKDVHWASSNKTVATVSDDGPETVVTGLTNGTAIISATTVSGGRSASCTLRVTGPVAVTGVTLNKTSTTLGIGTGETLIATVRPTTATNQNVTWETNAPTIVSVTQEGRITGLAAGNANITVTTAQGNFKATCAVTAMTAAPTTGVSLSRGSIMLEAGKSQTLVATVTPPNANNKDVQWSSTDPDVATVSSNGVVTGVAAGSATVTAAVAGFQVSCTVTVTTSIAMVTGGTDHSLAVKNDGTMWAWGRNNYYQVGDGGATGGNRTTPQLIAPDHEWTRVAACLTHSAAIHANGTLWTWGRNNYGQLGQGDTVDVQVPKLASTDNDWVDVQAGYAHMVALKSNGTLWICGSENYGVFGNGAGFANNGVRPTFRQIGTDTDWARVAVGYIHILALKTDGSLWVWGTNYYGGLGIAGLATGSGNGKDVPTRLGTDNDWVSIACGAYYSLGIKRDTSLWAWGQNTFGQIGDGTTTSTNNKLTPVRIGDGWATVAGGIDHSLGVKTDGTLWAWGRNNAGQLGDGATSTASNYATTPKWIGSDYDWAFVKAASSNLDAATSYGVKEDGSLWIWGRNNYGQVGNGNTTNQTRPVRIMSISE